MTLQQYYDDLVKHDWYHQHSDDHLAYERGERDYKRLRKIAEIGGQSYEKLLDQFFDHFYSGPAFKTENKPLPPRPTNEAA